LTITQTSIHFQKGDTGTGAAGGMVAVMSAVKGEYKADKPISTFLKDHKKLWIPLISLILTLLLSFIPQQSSFSIWGSRRSYWGSGSGWSSGGSSSSGGGASGSW
jgi:hypothetical protein